MRNRYRYKLLHHEQSRKQLKLVGHAVPTGVTSVHTIPSRALAGSESCLISGRWKEREETAGAEGGREGSKNSKTIAQEYLAGLTDINTRFHRCCCTSTLHKEYSNTGSLPLDNPKGGW